MRTIQPHEFDAATPVLDIRKHTHGTQIRGAVRYDVKKLLDADKLVLPLPKDATIVLCADDDAKLAGEVAEKLRAGGYGEAVLLGGTVSDWKDRGLPTEDTTQEQPIPGEEGAGMKRL